MNFSIFDKCNEEYFEEEVRKAYEILWSQLAKITAEKRTLLRNHLYYSPAITSLERKERELLEAINACLDYLRIGTLR